jgi:hypothetical protein
MITVQLTTRQFVYLKEAIRRDEEGLEDMAPWDIDGQTEEYEADLRRCREVGRILARVEQEQVAAH